ncbi:MAG TPA: PepSY-associated TM helix domain-containing protein [Thermomonospora sp.]|nr:PepSY-associated TM helix domain-containing protein [Thermomonospora sp.]
MRLHFYAGILVAPFLVLAALTGLACAAAPELDRYLYGGVLRAERADGPARPLADQVRAARAAQPEGAVTSVVPPADPGATTRVEFEVAGLADRRRIVHVDPYTARVRGVRTGEPGSTPVGTWLSEAHASLHLGAPGRLYLELAASWLWVIVLGGLVLWLGRGRHYRGRSPARRAFLHDRRARGVRRTRGRHAVAGVWTAAGLLVLSVTGLTWSDHAGARVDALERAFGGTPALDIRLPEEAARDEATSRDPGSQAGRVLAAARAAGLTGPVEITPALAPGTAWTVAQTDHRWPVRKDRVAVDPVTGRVTARVAWSDHPPVARLRFLGSQLHRGPLFGWANRVVLAVVMAGLLVVIARGYRMWWQRRPTRADRRAPFGRPPSRSAWRRLPVSVAVAGLPVLVALVWALPVLGLTLPLFLAVDASVGVLRRRRAPARPPP